MSGGSWEYLCHKGIDELVDSEDVIQKMTERLIALGYAADAAKETQELVLVIRQFRNHGTMIADRLSEIWKAVEWVDSGDWTDGHIQSALKAYRGL